MVIQKIRLKSSTMAPFNQVWLDVRRIQDLKVARVYKRELPGSFNEVEGFETLD